MVDKKVTKIKDVPLLPEKGSYQRGNIPLVSGKVNPEIQVGLNARYFLDAISVCDDDARITIGVTGEDKPIHFKHGEFNALIMPMRL